MSRDEPLIVRSLPVVDRKRGTNRLMAEYIAAGVTIAHEINPNSWSISHHNRAPTLLVADIDTALSGYFQSKRLDGGYSLTVCREGATGHQLKLIDSLTDWQWKTHPWAVYLRLPANQHLDERLAILAPKYFEAVERLAAWNTCHQAKHHEGMRNAVEVLTGASLPTPGYVKVEDTNHSQNGPDLPTEE